MGEPNQPILLSMADFCFLVNSMFFFLVPSSKREGKRRGRKMLSPSLVIRQITETLYYISPNLVFSKLPDVALKATYLHLPEKYLSISPILHP